MSEKSGAREQRGDPLCMYPRLECENCGHWIYASVPRRSERRFVYLECECKAMNAQKDDDPPEAWTRAF
jgi:hypothetical protein